MADSVNVAVLKGLIEIGYDPGKMATFLDQLTTAKAKQVSAKSESDRLKQSFDKLAASLDPIVARTLKYNQAEETLNRSLKAGIITQTQYNHNLAQAKERLQDTTTWTQKLGAEVGGSLRQHFSSLINPATLAIGAVAGIGAAVVGITKQIIEVTIEKEKTERLLEVAILRSANASSISLEEALKLAEGLSRLTGVDDDVIAAAEAVALRYNRISREIFPGVTKAALDVSKATGEDLSAAMEKVAKMVNNPLRALTLLNREGYAVSASQSEIVKSMLRTNDIAGAQEQILKIIQDRFEGTAVEARDTLGGAFEALGTEWENLLETLGEDDIGPVRDSLETIIDLIVTLTDNIDYLSLGWVSAEVDIVKANLKIAESIQAVLNAASLGAVGEIDAVKNMKKELAGLQDKQSKQLFKMFAPQDAKDFLNFVNGIVDGRKRVKGGTVELTEAEEKLKDELKKQREEWQKLLEVAANAVLTSKDELTNIQALLQARKTGIDAMKLEQAIQVALTKAKAAGKAATSEQRLEIIRNTVAIFQAKNAIDNIGEAEKRTAELFADSNKEMLRQITILSDLEQIVLGLSSASVDININQVSSGGQEATETTRARLDYAKEWRATWETASEAAQVEIQHVMDSLLTVEEKERAIAEIRSQLLDHNLSEWGSFFDTLGGMFGGIFKQISSAINNIQAAQKAGTQLGSLVGGAGSSLGATVGAFAAVLAVFYEIYKGVSAQIKKTNARKWGDVTQLEIVNGDWSQETFSKDRQGQQISHALRNYVRDLIAQIGAVVDDLPQITIRAQHNSKKVAAYVAGVFVGVFDSAEEATQEAVRYAITHANFDAISKEMAAALKASMDKTMEELQAAIEVAQSARRDRLGDVGSGYVEASDTRLREMEAMRQLGIGIEDSIEARQRELDAIKNSVLGIDTSAADRLRDIQSLSEGMTEAGNSARAMIEQQIALLQDQIRFAQHPRAGGSGGPGTNNTGGTNPNDGLGVIADFSESVDEETQRLQAALDGYIEMLQGVPEGLSDLEINMGVFDTLFDLIGDNAALSSKYSKEAAMYERMKVVASFEQLKLSLITMGKWAEFATMFDDVYQAALVAAGKPGGGARGAGGGRGVSADDTRSFITDRGFQLELNQMEEFARRRAEIEKEYQDKITALGGKDRGLRAAELIALRDKEIAQLVAEKAQRTVASFQDFVNPASSFEQVRKTAAGLIADINNSPFGDARKAKMIGRVLAEVDKQIEKLSKQEAVSLFSSMAGDLEKFGATEELQASVRQASALLEHELNLDNYRTRIALLEAEGKVSPEILAKLKEAFHFLEGVDVTKFGAGAAGSKSKEDEIYEKYGIRFRRVADSVEKNVEDISDSLNKLADSFKSAKDDIRSTLEEISRGDLGIVSPELAFDAAKKQYDATIKSAKGGKLIGFQEASEVSRNYIEALKAFSPALAAVSLPSIQEDLKLLLAAPNVKDENLIFSERFSEFSTAQEKAAGLLETGFSAVTNVSQKQTEIQSQMLGQLTELNRSNVELNAHLSRIESGNQGNKREVA